MHEIRVSGTQRDASPRLPKTRHRDHRKRGIVIYLFVGDVDAGMSIAGLFTLVATCEARGITICLPRLTSSRACRITPSRLDELLPGARAGRRVAATVLASSIMKAGSLVFAIVVGCGHNSTPTSNAASTKEAHETAVGAYLENPMPYLVASLGSCAFSGPVSKDLRPTAPGTISARCNGGISILWNAVPATSILIDGPATVRAPNKGLDYIYRVVYMARAKRLEGHGAIAWATAPNCDSLADLHQFNDATFVLPRAVGICTLQARDGEGRGADLTITIE